MAGRILPGQGSAFHGPSLMQPQQVQRDQTARDLYMAALAAQQGLKAAETLGVPSILSRGAQSIRDAIGGSEQQLGEAIAGGEGGLARAHAAVPQQFREDESGLFMPTNQGAQPQGGAVWSEGDGLYVPQQRPPVMARPNRADAPAPQPQPQPQPPRQPAATPQQPAATDQGKRFAAAYQDVQRTIVPQEQMNLQDLRIPQFQQAPAQPAQPSPRMAPEEMTFSEARTMAKQAQARGDIEGWAQAIAVAEKADMADEHATSFQELVNPGAHRARLIKDLGDAPDPYKMGTLDVAKRAQTVAEQRAKGYIQEINIRLGKLRQARTKDQRDAILNGIKSLLAKSAEDRALKTHPHLVREIKARAQRARAQAGQARATAEGTRQAIRAAKFGLKQAKATEEERKRLGISRVPQTKREKDWQDRYIKAHRGLMKALASSGRDGTSREAARALARIASGKEVSPRKLQKATTTLEGWAKAARARGLRVSAKEVIGYAREMRYIRAEAKRAGRGVDPNNILGAPEAIAGALESLLRVSDMYGVPPGGAAAPSPGTPATTTPKRTLPPGAY